LSDTANKKIKMKQVRNIILVILGNACYALSFNMFLLGNNIAPGGFSGIAAIINYLTGISVGGLVFVMNIPLFIISYRKMGKKFIIKSIFSVAVLSVLLDAFAILPIVTTDRLMASLYGGAIMGIGVGFSYIANAAAGGTELLSRLIIRYVKNLTMGKMMLLADGFVVLMAIVVYGNIESGLYAAMTVYLTSKVADGFIGGFDYANICYIVTDYPTEVSEVLMEATGRGVTNLKGTGMYTNQPRPVLMMVIKKTELVKVKELINMVDANAFFIVSEALEVLGQGFKTLSDKKE
jgi:uncharacterized membrane-anchored protein YitT (DUF2179 family)